MATLREYFDADFPHTIKLLAEFTVPLADAGEIGVSATVNVDFCSRTLFASAFVDGSDISAKHLSEIIEYLNDRWKAWPTPKEIRLPLAQTFPGQLTYQEQPFELRSTFYNGIETRLHDLRFHGRVYLYCDREFSLFELRQIREPASKHNLDVQLMCSEYRRRRDQVVIPQAFIIHDSRDKNDIARPLALKLQAMMIPVWYDEFSLKVGSGLRESVEAGIKKCPHCVVVVTKNFLSNQGWTKAEFDAVFTKQLMEKRDVVLPLWAGVTAEEVYEYSPWLLSRKAASWDEGLDMVATRLGQRIQTPYPWAANSG